MGAKHDVLINENTAITKEVFFRDVGGIIEGLLFYSDAYESRITVQTKCHKEFSIPMFFFRIQGFPAQQYASFDK